jgi:hypothetical protein
MVLICMALVNLGIDVGEIPPTIPLKVVARQRWEEDHINFRSLQPASPGQFASLYFLGGGFICQCDITRDASEDRFISN